MIFTAYLTMVTWLTLDLTDVLVVAPLCAPI